MVGFARRVMKNISNSMKQIDHLLLRQAQLEDKLDRALYYIDMIKNSRTIDLGEHRALTTLFTGQKIIVDTRDLSVAPHLMLDGHFELQVSQFAQKLVEALKPQDFLDIGANYAYYCLIVSSTTHKPRLHVFEPNPELIPLIEKSLLANGLDTLATINRVAVTDKNGTTKLRRLKDLWGGSTLHTDKDLKTYRPRQDEIDKEFDVDAVTLDSYLNKNGKMSPDLLKIDVEGYEDHVIAGMTKTLEKHKNTMTILLEFTQGAYKLEGGDRNLFVTLRKNFRYVYLIKDDGTFVEIKAYSDIASKFEHELGMLVISNRKEVKDLVS